MKKFITLAILAFFLNMAHAQFATCYSAFTDFEEIYTITTDGEHVYVGTNNTIHRSPDNGLNWAIMTGVGVNLPYSNKYMAILADGSNIYAGSDEGIYRSVNGGATFELKNNGMGSLQVLDILKVESNIYAGVNRWDGIIQYDQRILRSTDNCDTWTNISGDLPYLVNKVYAIAWDGTWLYAGTDRGVYRTQNHGENWIAMNNGLPEWNVYKLLVVNNSVVFAGNDDGLYRWTNSEGTWSKLSNGLPENTSVAGLAKVDTKIFATFSLETVFVSPDLGENWYNIGLGLGTNTLGDIAVNEDYVFVLTHPIQHLQLPGKVHRRLLEEALGVKVNHSPEPAFRFLENPVQDFISIVNRSGAQAVVYFYSNDGRLLLQANLSEGVNTIDIRHLPHGLLLLQCTGANMAASARIMKI